MSLILANGCVFVDELSGSVFESSYSDLDQHLDKKLPNTETILLKYVRGDDVIHSCNNYEGICCYI